MFKVKELEQTRDLEPLVEGTDAVDNVPGWAAAKLGFAADPARVRVLRSASRRVILNCTRQWGKSTVTAAKAVHAAVTLAESLTVVVSPSARQSGEFVRKAESFVRRLGMRVRGDGDNVISLAFDNGSRIVGLPASENTVRGFSAVGLLLADEPARVSDELYVAVRPMLAVSGGTLWLMSTPRGKRGFFYDTWREAGAEWERVQVTAAECPRIPRSFLEEERRTMEEQAYQQRGQRHWWPSLETTPACTRLFSESRGMGGHEPNSQVRIRRHTNRRCGGRPPSRDRCSKVHVEHGESHPNKSALPAKSVPLRKGQTQATSWRSLRRADPRLPASGSFAFDQFPDKRRGQVFLG
jgi:hypothetical protein